MTDRESDGPAPPVTREAVRDRLDCVTDPELDRSIVELEYVDAIEIDGDRVTIHVTLPTAWCSPAFAWMMAADAREEVESLPGVERGRIYLHEHMHEAEINRGVNAGLSFEDAFPDADGGIDPVRAELDRKARIARQYDAVEVLQEAGLDPETIVSLRLRDFERADRDDRVTIYLADRAVGVTVPAEPIDDYLEKARETGITDAPTDVLFRTPEGEPIDPEEFELVHRRGRLTQVNMSGQGGICDGLREARENRLERTPSD
ncbi:metal-sulfur cluster biosynthetic enzyme [Natronococcus pandeyae]|uniref:Metal-sulfur cluster biosynthetic enzyme n=1 Tax=Natronococcus pandeyae TaxID=2055836 RepID=A0A8J8TT32_9EURY|nr:iron-sulfur cluster assembly protein [Natronococcus pandeyae]TYL39730.1 metal-sulfur cluster biosynthetic enzyme [Natronococcus pandeyae]